MTNEADTPCGPVLVFIDGCAVNRFALVNLDPLKGLVGHRFTVAMTDDLAAEYERARDHLFVPPYVKALIHKLLAGAVRVPLKSGASTDARLVALSRTAIVISDDGALLRAGHAGMVAWSDVEAHWRAEGDIANFLGRRARALNTRPHARSNAAGVRSAIVG